MDLKEGYRNGSEEPTKDPYDLLKRKEQELLH